MKKYKSENNADSKVQQQNLQLKIQVGTILIECSGSPEEINKQRNYFVNNVLKPCLNGDYKLLDKNILGF